MEHSENEADARFITPDGGLDIPSLGRLRESVTVCPRLSQCFRPPMNLRDDQPLPRAADTRCDRDAAPSGTTQPSIRRDFVEWHRGRQPYAFWGLDVDMPVVSVRIAACAAHLGEWLLDGYARQPHVTLDLCGFPNLQLSSADEFGPELLAHQVAALRSAGPAPFAIEIGDPDSFQSAPYLAVRDPAGGIAALRRCLAIDGEHRLFGDYVPHVTLGLYAQAVPFAVVLERLLACRMPEPLLCQIDRLSLMAYDPAEIGGRLIALADYQLASGELCWHDHTFDKDLAFLKSAMDV